MKNALNTANSDIRIFNESVEKKYNDPLNYDMAETVGAAVYLSQNKLYYGFLEDCYFNVLDGKTLKDATLIFKDGRISKIGLEQEVQTEGKVIEEP